MRKKELKCLTGLRFILALWVLAFHATEWKGVFLLGRIMVIPGLKFISCGYLAVSGFFCLSGFILAYNYSDRLETRDGRMHFWRARIARIYPVYLLAIIAWTPIAVLFIRHGYFSNNTSVKSAVLSVFLIQAWIPSLDLAWNGPAWSLSAEAFFYLLLPVYAGKLRRLNSAKLLSAIFWCSAIAAMLFSFENRYGLGRFPIIRLPEFVAGYCAGLIFLNFPNLPRKWCGWLAIGSGAIILILANFMAGLHAGFGVATIFFVILIYGLANPPGWLDWAMGNQVMHFLGEASYALYLFHLTVAFGLQALWGQTSTWQHHPLLMFPIYVIAALALASFVHLFLERPMRKVIMKPPPRLR